MISKNRSKHGRVEDIPFCNNILFIALIEEITSKANNFHKYDVLCYSVSNKTQISLQNEFRHKEQIEAMT